jgi:hypothetical protein
MSLDWRCPHGNGGTIGGAQTWINTSALLATAPDGGRDAMTTQDSSTPRTIVSSLRGPIEDRFWTKIRLCDNGCWEWDAAKIHGGYGVIRTGRPHKMVKAHRFAWEWFRGPIPPGLCVCHHCDNPPCVNPSHLFLGNNSDNVRDSMEKGRYKNGTLTHCQNGHEYTPENTYFWGGSSRPGRRNCRACSLAWRHKYVADRKMNQRGLNA